MSHVHAHCRFSIPFVFVLQTLYLMHRLGLESESKVAVWTEKQFILLLTCPQESQGCQEIEKKNTKLKKLQKTIKIAQKLSKMPVF